jgi:hypothetical protein
LVGWTVDLGFYFSPSAFCASILGDLHRVNAARCGATNDQQMKSR